VVKLYQPNKKRNTTAGARMGLTPQIELVKWIERKKTAVDEADAALKRARFCEQMIQRLLGEAGLEIPGVNTPNVEYPNVTELPVQRPPIAVVREEDAQIIPFRRA
jgi:hypothetical protein